ncbi:hypothetical protein [Neorickettsia sennetsu]|uniref:hypothetical protein n=1 Tax=Ehrlichia sennetsu TaxID=951 RepID=UPI0002DAB0FE|nr:hypothetical protein [Neorickettsia sennetsu]
MQKSDVDLLKKGLLDKRTIAVFSVMACVSAFAVGEHIFLRFPWKTNTIVHGQCVWLYLFPPILAVASIGAFKLFQLVEPTSTLRAAVQEILDNEKQNVTLCPTYEKRTIVKKVDEAAYALEKSFKPRAEEALVISAVLSVACITVAGCLDKTTHPVKMKTLAMVESALFASTLASLLVLWVILYFIGAGKNLQSNQPQGRKRIYELTEGLQLTEDPLSLSTSSRLV